MVITAKELYQKLDEIRTAIGNNTAQDGSCLFDVQEVMLSLNLALRCANETAGD